MENKKYTDTIPTPKKYQKSIKLIEKFEAMTSDERQEYLDNLEVKIKKIKKFSDELDKKISLYNFEGKQELINTLKSAAELGTMATLLGMANAPIEEQLYVGLLAGLNTSEAYIFADCIGGQIKAERYAKKLDKLIEEWVACSYVENTSAQEKEM